jgi:hypothetical protein
MVKINLGDMMFRQPAITPEKIQTMLTSPRRRRLTPKWKGLGEPSVEGGDWNVGVPLKPYTKAFDEVFFPKINHIGWREGNSHTYYTYLKDVDEEDLEEIREWLEKMRGWVGIRDCLPISFALDFDRKDGNPDLNKTKIGTLREEAKPYDRTPNDSHYEAAEKLAENCIAFLNKVGCYNSLDAVIAVPPSSPEKEYSLPGIIANHIAEEWERDDLSDAVIKIKETKQAKNVALEDKLANIEGSIQVLPKVKGLKILLIDDLYQSGITMNYVAMLLVEQGAKKVYGLACEKTCRNDDNISGQHDRDIDD